MRPDVFDTAKADTVIRADVDHRSLHRMMRVASGDRWCDYSCVRRIAGHRPRFGKAAFGSPFSFLANSRSHVSLHLLPGDPGCDGSWRHDAKLSDSKGRKPVSDLGRRGRKLVFDLCLYRSPKQLRFRSNGCFSSVFVIECEPIMHRSFNVGLSFWRKIAIVKLGRNRRP